MEVSLWREIEKEQIPISGNDPAAYEVAYDSVSEFNREYSRFFGQPPVRDIKALRNGNIMPIKAA